LTETTDETAPTLGGRYRLDAQLARGGMGVVHRGTRLSDGRPVAVKLLPRGGDATARRRFELEAQTLSALSHPHIVDLLDFGADQDGRPYLVMEYLAGETLADALERDGALPPERATLVTRQLLEALAAAHRAGLVHRDLKPSNVFLTTRGRRTDFVKLIDFGVARPAGAPRVGVTAADDIVGSPRYMSPEQAQRRPLTAASDLYALGCVAYEMLTGAPPFADADNAVACVLAHSRRTPEPPRRDGAVVDGPLASWAMRCLAKAAWDRPGAEVMRAALEVGAEPPPHDEARSR